MCLVLIVWIFLLGFVHVCMVYCITILFDVVLGTLWIRCFAPRNCNRWEDRGVSWIERFLLVRIRWCSLSRFVTIVTCSWRSMPLVFLSFYLHIDIDRYIPVCSLILVFHVLFYTGEWSRRLFLRRHRIPCERCCMGVQRFACGCVGIHHMFLTLIFLILSRLLLFPIRCCSSLSIGVELRWRVQVGRAATGLELDTAVMT